MRAVDGLYLSAAECRQLAPVLMHGATVLHDLGEHPTGADVAALAVMCAAVAGAVAEPVATVADPRQHTVAMTTLTEWAARNQIAQRTARRWALAGRIPGAVRTPARWLVPDDQLGPAAA